jgi:hypothetical protein
MMGVKVSVQHVTWSLTMVRVRFDDPLRSFASGLSRRATLAALASGVFGAGSLALLDLAEAKKKHKRKHKHKKKKKVTFNEFGCVNVGGFCRSSNQCCSGICGGKKDKRKCQAHDTGGCQGEPGQDRCLDVKVNCVTELGVDGFCTRTTGNAGYCEATLGCFACTKDADCVPFCGAQAACIVCAGCAEEVGSDTACVGPTNNSCHLQT